MQARAAPIQCLFSGEILMTDFLAPAEGTRCNQLLLFWLDSVLSASGPVPRWILPFSHDNVQKKSLVDQMAADKVLGTEGKYAQLRVLFMCLAKKQGCLCSLDCGLGILELPQRVCPRKLAEGFTGHCSSFARQLVPMLKQR